MEKRMIFGCLVLLVLALGLLALRKDAVPPKGNLSVGSQVLFVEVARTAFEKARGLSDRENLCPDCGMLFVYESPKIQNFWMMGMKFALDFVFIREGAVVEVRENIPVTDFSGVVTRIQSREEADMVLEVKAGFTSRNNIKTGDRVSLDSPR